MKVISSNCNVLNILSRFFMPFSPLRISTASSQQHPEHRRWKKRHWSKLNFLGAVPCWWLFAPLGVRSRPLPRHPISLSYAPQKINHMNVRHYFRFTSYCLILEDGSSGERRKMEKNECIKKIKTIKKRKNRNIFISNFSCFYFPFLRALLLRNCEVLW